MKNYYSQNNNTLQYITFSNILTTMSSTLTDDVSNNTSAAADNVPVPKRTQKSKQKSVSKKRKAPEVVSNADVESAVVVSAASSSTTAAKVTKKARVPAKSKKNKTTAVVSDNVTKNNVRKSEVLTPLHLVDTDDNHAMYKTWCREIGAHLTRKQFSTMLKRQRAALGDMCRRSNKRVVVVDETLDMYGKFLAAQKPEAFKELHGKWIRVYGISGSIPARDLSANRELSEEYVHRQYMYEGAKMLFDMCVRNGYTPLGIASAGKARDSDDYNVKLSGPSVSVIDRNAAQGVPEPHNLALVSGMCVRKSVDTDEVFGVGRPITTHVPTSRKTT